MITIGLTGGIGSGKTTVAKVFEAMGCVLYSSDDRAKAVYFRPDVRRQVIALLGPEVYINEVTLNRELISSKVFADKQLLEQLNAIIHPALRLDLAEFKAAQKKDAVIVKETALLFEAGIHKSVEASVLVMAPLELRIRRVMQRNKVSREEVIKRMDHQWPDEKKIGLADFVITNDGSVAVIPQVQKVLQQLRAA